MTPHQSRNHLTLELGKGEWYTSNARLHHMDRYRRSQAIRRKTAMLARHQLRRVTVPVIATTFVAYPKGTGRADPSNVAGGVAKHVFDGITDAGIWVDDDSTHVIDGGYRRDPNTDRTGLWRIRVVLTPIDDNI